MSQRRANPYGAYREGADPQVQLAQFNAWDEGAIAALDDVIAWLRSYPYPDTPAKLADVLEAQSQPSELDDHEQFPGPELTDELPEEEIARFYARDPEIQRQMKALAERETAFHRLKQNLPPWALSIAQTAQELGVSEEEVRALIADKKLAAVAGRIVTRGALGSCIRRRDLEQFPGPELTDPWEPDQR